jgi:hypothetical protein
MKPSKEYLDHIAKRLEAMNPWVGVIPGDDSKISGYKLPSLHDQMGQAAIEYMKNKKDPEIKPNPLFPDRNSY